MKSYLRALWYLLLTIGLSSCARHVVLDPESAARRNSSDWKLKATPGGQSPDGGLSATR